VYNFFLCLPEYNVLNHVCVNVVMASKTVVANLNREEKLDGKNYDIWHCKIHYLLNELEVLETLTNSMEKPEQENSAQNRRDLEAYQN
jgi:hypothetical protein